MQRTVADAVRTIIRKAVGIYCQPNNCQHPFDDKKNTENSVAWLAYIARSARLCMLRLLRLYTLHGGCNMRGILRCWQSSSGASRMVPSWFAPVIGSRRTSWQHCSPTHAGRRAWRVLSAWQLRVQTDQVSSERAYTVRRYRRMNGRRVATHNCCQFCAGKRFVCVGELFVFLFLFV